MTGAVVLLIFVAALAVAARLCLRAERRPAVPVDEDAAGPA